MFWIFRIWKRHLKNLPLSQDIACAGCFKFETLFSDVDTSYWRWWLLMSATTRKSSAFRLFFDIILKLTISTIYLWKSISKDYQLKKTANRVIEMNFDHSNSNVDLQYLRHRLDILAFFSHVKRSKRYVMIQWSDEFLHTTVQIILRCGKDFKLLTYSRWNFPEPRSITNIFAPVLTPMSKIHSTLESRLDNLKLKSYFITS